VQEKIPTLSLYILRTVSMHASMKEVRLNDKDN
jgi:hypothetical protein